MPKTLRANSDHIAQPIHSASLMATKSSWNDLETSQANGSNNRSNKSGSFQWALNTDVDGRIDLSYLTEAERVQHFPSHIIGGAVTQEYESQLYLVFDKIDESTVTVSIKAISCVSWNQHTLPHLYNLPSGDDEPMLSTAFEEPELGVPSSPSPQLGSLSDISSSSSFSFPDSVDFTPTSFWIEGSIRTHSKERKCVQYTCQFVVEGRKCTSKDGSLTGTEYASGCDNSMEFDLENSLDDLWKETSAQIQSESLRDGFDLYARTTAHLVLVLYMGHDPVGEIYFPIHTIQSHEAWHPLLPSEKSFTSRMQQVKRGWGMWLPNSIKRSHKKGKGYWPTMRWPRKVISLRSLCITLIFVQLCFVITTTAVVLSLTANRELQHAAQGLARAVQQKINEALVSRLNGPVTYVMNTRGYKSFDMQGKLSTRNLYLHYLARNFARCRQQNLVSSNQFFLGFPSNMFFGIGVQYQYFSSPPMESSDISELMTYSKDDPSEPLTVNLYEWNVDCHPANFTCNPSNFSSPILPSLLNVDVTDRLWYMTAMQTSSPVWTDVYFYITGILGITVATRIPSSLDLPLEMVSGADISLSDMGNVLERLRYYTTGFGFLVGLESGYLVASSKGIPVSVNNKRVLANESADEDIRNTMLSLQALCPHEQRSRLSCIISNNKNNTTISASNDFISVQGFEFLSVPDKWAMVVVIPYEDFTSGFRHMVIVSIMCSLLLLGISVACTVIVVNTVTVQLIQCTLQLSQFAKLDFSTKVTQTELNSPIKEISRIYEALRNMRLTVRSFYKYVPLQVVQMIFDTNQEAHLCTQRKQLTLFFSDVVDFTTISEMLTLEELIDMLGLYLNEMSQIIQCNEGVVDKYIGDAVMAIWNAPDNIIDHPTKACEAALLCQARLTVLQKEWTDRGFPLLSARIGIHTGTAIVGNLGARQRINYSAMGDTVNMAEKLEGLSKMYGTNIIISEDTHYYVKHKFICRPLDTIPACRRSGTMMLYELISHRTTATNLEVLSANFFSHAYEDFLQGDFENARELFLQYCTVYQHDCKAAKLLIESCDYFMKYPPPADWKGLRHTHYIDNDGDSD